MTPIETMSLTAGIVCVGLFSGLMMSLVVLLQPKWRQQSAAEYITDIQPFLRVGKGNRVVTLILFVGLLAPIPTLLGSDPQTRILTLVGLIVFGCGALGITVLFNLPTYAALMRLNAQSPTPDWEALRQRFYYLNVLRFLGSTTAFALYLSALIGL